MSKALESLGNIYGRTEAQKSVCSLLKEHTNNRDQWYTVSDDDNYGNCNDHSNNKLQEWWRRSTNRLKQSQNSDKDMTIEEDNNNDMYQDKLKFLRKAGVAVAGGTMVGVGIPLIPLPGPGELIIVGGVALLATEFPAAQKVLDDARDKVADLCIDEEQEQEEKSSAQYENDITETTMENIKISAKWVGKQILPVLDHFASNKPDYIDDIDAKDTGNLRLETNEETIVFDDDIIDSSSNVHWM